MTRHDTSVPPLSLERFRDLVDAYGADLARMPEDERDRMRALLACSDEARTVWGQARALDDLLASSPAHEPSAALAQALASIPERHAQQGVVVQLSPFRSRVWLALAAAAAVVLGVLSGTQDTAQDEVAVQTEPTSATGREEELYAELGALAFTTELFADFESFEGEPE